MPTNLVPMAWIEHATSPLPRECSTTELHGRNRSGAGEGNRTLVLSLEGFSSTIELHPPATPSQLATPCKTSRHHSSANFLVEGEGFEPSKAEPSDLQSDPFDRSGTPPAKRRIMTGRRHCCQWGTTKGADLSRGASRTREIIGMRSVLQALSQPWSTVNPSPRCVRRYWPRFSVD